VAHACNPSYLGGKDQEDCSLKPAQARLAGNSLQDPISKKAIMKKDVVEWLKVYPLSSNPSTAKKQKQKTKNKKNLHLQPGVVAYAHNTITWDTEA
jgi:hypothetical protein